MEKGLRTVLKLNNNITNEQRILKHPQTGEASKFYFACRNGDTDLVKRMLPTIPFNRLNQLEPNGSTPLHAATYFGHLEIVRLLLQEYGCQRYQKNFHGLTAYEEIHTDEMRQLYRRPSNRNRFLDELNSIQQTFKIVSSPIDKIEIDDDEITNPNKTLLTNFQTNEEIKKQLDGINGIKTLLQSHLGRYLMKHTLGQKHCGFDDEEYAYVANKLFGDEALRRLVDDYVTVNHPDYKHCCHLLNEFSQHQKIEYLLTLYSMETPFYYRLLTRVNPLAFPFFMHLSDLKQRYYQGESYRGVQMTREELCEYRRALTLKDSIVLTTRFTSTSMVRSVAEQFTTQPSSDKTNVLLIFYFPQPCDTAINLSKIPGYQLSSISIYEDENEVLIGPRTFFRIKDIEANGQQIIHLENIASEHKTVLGTVYFFIKNHFEGEMGEGGI